MKPVVEYTIVLLLVFYAGSGRQNTDNRQSYNNNIKISSFIIISCCLVFVLIAYIMLQLSLIVFTYLEVFFLIKIVRQVALSTLRN